MVTFSQGELLLPTTVLNHFVKILTSIDLKLFSVLTVHFLEPSIPSTLAVVVEFPSEKFCMCGRREEEKALKNSPWTDWEFLLRAGHIGTPASRFKTKWKGGKTFIQMRLYLFSRNGGGTG